MGLKALLISSILLLPGCGTLDKLKRDVPPQIITEWRTFDCGVPPATDRVNFRPVEWEIIDGLFTLSTDMYANLGENMQEIIKASGQLVEVVRFYESCIEAANTKTP